MKTKEEIFKIIEKKLEFEQLIKMSLRVTNDNFEHYRFDMSGYDIGKKGICTVGNMGILNRFADLGIYDYTHFLFLDFYKGTPILYLIYWGESDLRKFEFSGLGTKEIIYEILMLTVYSGKNERRRGL